MEAVRAHELSIGERNNGVDRGEEREMGLADILSRIDVKKARHDAARPLPSASVRSWMEDFRIRYAHETTAR
ncbi:MAG: hypothetical protein K6T83_23045 [Alicyclobacillus sp.]|nr:hypothetical protein [Alicyclobacillus sp.]